MKRLIAKRVGVCLASGLLVLLPALASAQSGQSAAGPPPIGQQLIREGDFAITLAAALSLGTSNNEVEAENQLAQAGIMPKNGWIADYPVTPDIIDDVYMAVHAAADAGKIPLAADVAFQRLNDTIAQFGLSVRTPSGGDINVARLPEAGVAPSPADISDYYYDEGPPVVTYYAPPPDYSYLYGWVPFPFWCDGFWFPGYFILHDFHRYAHHGGRDRFVSNHFDDERHHRVFRIDPVARMDGRTMGLNSITPRAGFSREMIDNLHGRTTPHNGRIDRPISPTVRRGRSSFDNRVGHGYHGRPVTSESFGMHQRGPAAMPPSFRAGSGRWNRGSIGMPPRAYHGSGSPSRSSGFVGMNHPGGGFGGRGHR